MYELSVNVDKDCSQWISVGGRGGPPTTSCGPSSNHLLHCRSSEGQQEQQQGLAGRALEESDGRDDHCACSPLMKSASHAIDYDHHAARMINNMHPIIIITKMVISRRKEAGQL